MPSTGHPARSPLFHLERVRSTPDYDPAAVPPLRRAIGSYDLYRPTNPSPLRLVTNAPVQPPSAPLRQVSIADLETLRGRIIAHKQGLSAPKDVRFKGPEIVIPPPPTSPVSPTLPIEDILAEARKPSDPSDILNRPGLGPSSITTNKNAPFTSWDHTRLSSFFNQETPIVDELPDSPSMYSPTPPNSSAPTGIELSESSTGWPNFADIDLAIMDIRHHHASVEEPSGEELSDEQPTGERPYGTGDVGDGLVSDDHRGNVVADAQSWWDRVSIVAGSVTLSLTSVWEKHADTTAAKKSNGTKNVGNHAQEAIKMPGEADTPEEPSQHVDWLSRTRKAEESPQQWLNAPSREVNQISG